MLPDHELLRRIAESTAPHVGEAFLRAFVGELAGIMGVAVAFISQNVDRPATKARTLVCWQNGEPGADFEYVIDGGPCAGVYRGEAVAFPCNLAEHFTVHQQTGLQSYLGLPLTDNGEVVGGLTVLDHRPIEDLERRFDVIRIFAARAEAELRRMRLEAQREDLIRALTQSNRHLAWQHDIIGRANRFKTQMLGMAAHDLKNPLNIVLSHAEFIALEAENPLPDATALTTIRDDAQAIALTVQRMRALIDQLLVNAREQTAELQLTPTGVDLVALAQRIQAENLPLAAKKHQQLSLSAPASQIVEGDAERLREALDNLVSNAIKYSPPGQPIALSISVQPNVVEFAVTDRGPGLTNDERNRLFQPFSQGSAKPTAQESSTGLGLSIVRMVVELHGGSVGVDSDGPGTGSRFWLRLPLHAAATPG